MRYGRYVPCEWTVYLPSRLSNISAVTEAGRQITLVTFLYGPKLNYLKVS